MQGGSLQPWPLQHTVALPSRRALPSPSMDQGDNNLGNHHLFIRTATCSRAAHMRASVPESSLHLLPCSLLPLAYSPLRDLVWIMCS